MKNANRGLIGNNLKCGWRKRQYVGFLLFILPGLKILERLNKLDRSGFLGLREKIINFGKDMHYNHIMKIEYNLNF